MTAPSATPLPPLTRASTPGNPPVGVAIDALIAHMTAAEADLAAGKTASATLAARVAALEALPVATQPVVEVDITAVQESALASVLKGGLVVLRGPAFDLVLLRK